MSINMNKLAKDITEQEGGRVEVNIAQVKEVLKVALDLLAQEKPSDVLRLLESR